MALGQILATGSAVDRLGSGSKAFRPLKVTSAQNSSFSSFPHGSKAECPVSPCEVGKGVRSYSLTGEEPREDTCLDPLSCCEHPEGVFVVPTCL